jgi:hypothetical protein
MQNLDKLLYWMDERENIRVKKEAGDPKPWSEDPVFQQTYFCNVHREDDRVTKWIRGAYSPYVGHELFVPNIILSRFLNWPPSLEAIGYLDDWDPTWVKIRLNHIKNEGKKVWGNAYVVTTHGIKMDKMDYLCDRVMPTMLMSTKLPTTTLADAATHLQLVEGISTFMAGQVVADLKNTEGHPLKDAPDWLTFALPGPGSRRGMAWLYGENVREGLWYSHLLDVQIKIALSGWKICAQDLQNCLCEFDKYMRVKTQSGRSKRGYDGT